MPPTEIIQNQLKKLKARLHQYNYQYYVLDAPVVDDSTYDVLYRELVALELQYPELVTPDSPTQRVGAEPLKKFEQAEHPVRLYSLDNVFNSEELLAWQARNLKYLDLPEGVSELDYVAELKIDGLAVSLLYEKGHLVRGATRGNGVVGENITANIKTIRSIPLVLQPIEPDHADQPGQPGPLVPDAIEVRGEIVMPKAAFLALNQHRKQLEEPLFANPRNAAAGTVRQLDPQVTASRNLDALFYDITLLSPQQEQPAFLEKTKTHWQRLALLAGLGFKVNPAKAYCKTLNDTHTFVVAWEDQRKTLSFETDGVVIKVNQSQYQQQLGYTAKSPRWAIAHKYTPEIQETQVLAIEFSVGRTGVITPIAILQPVLLSGSTVQRASLHNFDELSKKDVRIGDWVSIQKAAEIIPEVIAVILQKRLVDTVPVSRPAVCPSCGNAVFKTDSEVALRCLAVNRCPAQRLGQLEHWVSKAALNIDGVGVALLQQLVATDKVKSPVDLYRLSIADVLSLERTAQKSAENAINAIEASKSRPLSAVIYGLGIRFVGSETASILASHFGSLTALKAATTEDLLPLPGIGEKVAASVVDFFSVDSNAALLDELIAMGIHPVQEKTSAIDNTVLAGKTVVITGTLPTLSRAAATDLIRQHGGKVSGSVSAKTSFLLCGDSAGSKLSKAESLGVTVLSEDEFLRKLAGETD
ncbi:MAG: NAD-dependent DNA ligase LigA [Cyanobacteria bacterium P01_H01_bin.74]